MALIEPQNLSNSQKLDNFIGENYEISLKHSIQSLLDTFRNPNFDFSTFTSNFQELLKVKVDPPIETIWFYSAVIFRKLNSEKDEILDQFSAIKDLFDLLTSCSASCSSSKSVALIAPVIYELCNFFVNFKGNEVGSKREKKVMKEIKSLVDVILGYVNVCVCGNVVDGDESIRSLGDLSSVWIGDGKNKSLKCFFPLLSDEIVEGLSVESCDVDELAGVVIVEAFLLKMCLEFREGTSRKKLQEELRIWAVGSVTGFKNLIFFETLVKMLLEQTLPVTSLLSSEDEIILRKVLYDVVILPEYSFLKPDRMIHQPVKPSLAIARLMVTHEATELYRKDGDHVKAISYLNAFSASHLPTELIKWITSEISMGSKSSGPNGSSPKAILKWIYNLEDQGINILDNDMSKYRTRFMLDSMEIDDEQPDFSANGKKLDADFSFYIDNKGNEDLDKEADDNNEPTSDAFVAAAHSMQSTEDGGKRKRKERKRSEKKNVKFLKHNIYEQSSSSGGDESPSFIKDGSSSGSEIENPQSDNDNED